MPELYQNGFFKSKYFKLTQKGLFVTEKSIKRTIEMEIPFEDISNKVRLTEYKKIIWIMLSILSVGIVLIPFLSDNGSSKIVYFFPFFLIFFSLFLFLYFYTTEKFIMIMCPDGKAIQFFDQHKTRKETQEFIGKVLENRKTFLKSKYAFVDKDLPYQFQLNNLNWLLEESVITEHGYDSLKKELNQIK